MSALLSFPLLWSQVLLPGVPDKFRALLLWLLVLGEPAQTIRGFWGGVISWVKVISLFCLLGWVLSWVVAAIRERIVGRGNWLDIAGLLALICGVGAAALNVMGLTGRLEAGKLVVGGISLSAMLGLIAAAVVFIWVEAALWSTIRRLGRAGDLLVLAGIHLALIASIALGMYLQRVSIDVLAQAGQKPTAWHEGVTYGAWLSGAYMGYVVLLRVVILVLRETFAVRPRRLYAIARLSVLEATRRMWAPWVVITVFLVVLAFTHWFLQPPRPAEMGRLFVGTLALLCSLLVTVMITILTPLSLPSDIQYQTIYTVVSKPVRRIELIWGRMIGYMAIVTFLVLIFGGISLIYLKRTVGGAIEATKKLADDEAAKGRMTQANHLYEEAAQLRARMSAREPIRGSLTFIDSKGIPRLQGIDVGQEQSMRQPRSHIEGATPLTAIWRYGVVPDPFHPQIPVDRRIPVSRLLALNTIEYWMNEAYDLRTQIALADRRQGQQGISAEEARRLTANVARNREELKNAEGAVKALKGEDAELERQAVAAEKAGRATEAASIRERKRPLHTPQVAVEMNFNVYRTTKGKIGEPVLAEIEVTNEFTGETRRNFFPIREYYTNRQYIPASLLAGSNGALTIEIRCMSPTQYLGMAESDLYILAQAGDFGTNFMKGLFGVWLQAMVLTAIGVFAGTFLSWPVALLTTIAFFVAGHVFFAFLLDFQRQSILGGGPFESLIRLLTHDNQMSELTPTLAVVTAKTLDSIVMPVMARLVFVVPNFAALDVSNTVADGFEVRWGLLGSNLLLALAYTLPFSIAGYFILKNREVAA